MVYIIMEKLRVAVIGQGRSGYSIHSAYFLSEANDIVDVVAVVDFLADRREKAKEKFGCDVYADYTELFGRTDIDLVVNASYSHMHYPITKDLLLHGFNVLTEKPFGATWVQTQELIRIAEKKNLLVAAFHQSLLAPNYKKVKEIIASGVLGKLKEVKMYYSGFARRWDWQTVQCNCAGSVYNTGPHPIGLALDLLDWDENAKVAYADLDNLLASGDAEDFAKIILTAPGKHITDIEISPVDAFIPGYQFKVCGTQGTLIMYANRYSLKYIVPEENPPRPLIRESLANANGDPIYCGEKLEWHTEEGDVTGSAFDSAVNEFYHMVYSALREGKPLYVTPQMASRVVHVIETCHALNPLPVEYTLED